MSNTSTLLSQPLSLTRGAKKLKKWSKTPDLIRTEQGNKNHWCARYVAQP
jgi:hypothetical protein